VTLRLASTAVCLGLLFASACATPPPPRPAAMTRLHPSGPSPWREDFGDPVLADLLARADREAVDVKTALAQLERADAQVRAARAAKGLSVDIGADAAAGYAVHDSQRSGARSGATPSLTVAYEADLFKRLSLAAQAAQSERRASEADVAGARLLVGSQTASAYLALRLAQTQVRDAAILQAAAGRAFQLTSTRVQERKAGREDVAARQQAVSDANALMAAAQLDLRTAELRLSALTEETPTADGAIPTAPPLRPIASDRVDLRPDVQAAYQRLLAADSQRAAAVAAQRPRFEIGLSLGAVEPSVLNLLDARSLVWAAAASLSHDLFDNGRGAARTRIATSEADLAELAYRKASLQGWTDMQLAAVQVAAADEDVVRARLALERKGKITRAGQLQHGEGLIDGIGLADLEGQEATARRAVAEAQVRALTARIALTLADGGS
jgi:outer membrane protein TolC